MTLAEASQRRQALSSRIGPMDAAADPADCDRTRPVATPGGRNGPKPDFGLEGVVEPALARALVLAAEAGRWEIVEQIARELKERCQGRQDTTPPVVVRLHRSSARP